MLTVWPKWATYLDYDLIRKIAVTHTLEPRLLAAVVQTESAGNTYAARYEPHFKHVFQVPQFANLCHCTPETMMFMQKTSWGLCQVMGAVAYEHDLHKEYTWHRRWPTALTNPAMGLKYGCLHLKLKYEKYGPDSKTVYAAYNAGSPRYKANGNFVNQVSVDRFFRFYSELPK